MRLEARRIEFFGENANQLAKQFEFRLRRNEPVKGGVFFHPVAALLSAALFIRPRKLSGPATVDCRSYVPDFVAAATSFELISRVIMKPLLPLNSNALSPVRYASTSFGIMTKP